MDPFTPLDWGNTGDGTTLVHIVGILLPMLTAALTKRFASSRLKAVVTLVLSALTAAVGQITIGDAGIDLSGFVHAFNAAFVTAIASYYGFLRPAGVTDGIANATSGFGIGSEPEPDGETYAE